MGQTVLTAGGKFVHAGAERFLIKGVTYGTFAPDSAGHQFPHIERTVTDFRMMREAGINTVRTYTVPSSAVLDAASAAGLRLMVGIPWPQHLAFLDDRKLRRNIRRSVVDAVRGLSGHSAIALFALGNEIPPGIVRWHGRGPVQEFLHELYLECKSAAPECLLTYVNYPPTEYLDIPSFDVCTFNLYLHAETDLRRYLARLQHLAGFKPLLIGEIGLDATRNGALAQAAVTSAEVRAIFEEGAAGAIVFAWTDEWWRGGAAVTDWAFGLVDRQRRPKPALEAVSRAFDEVPFSLASQHKWPKVSVIVCAYNAAATIADCLSALARVDYSDFEVIVVNDGSTDLTGDIVRNDPMATLIDVPSGGLSVTRNVGLHHASGDVVAYVDADVRVDAHWLTYLVQPFLNSDVVAVGGPNVVPPDDPWVAQCIARSPGGPTHVLLDDRIAEHVPGCNMAFRREALLAVGGFNPIFLRAADDVDLCWRLQARGWRIGFAPSALVWHHHRHTIRAYWRQQVGYGEGETWLRSEHPHKFVGTKPAWRGHIYSPLPFVRHLSQTRIHSGVWGGLLYPSVYRMDTHPFAYMPHGEGWQFVSIVLLLSGGAVATLLRDPLVIMLPVLGLVGVVTTTFRCLQCAMRTDIDALPAIGHHGRATTRLLYRSMIATLHFLQPLARLHGRIRGMLWHPGTPRPLRRRWRESFFPPRLADLVEALWLVFGRPRERAYWSEQWQDVAAILSGAVAWLRAARAVPVIEVDDGWQRGRDLSVGLVALAWLDLEALVEDHGGRKCLLRERIRWRPTSAATAAGLASVALLVLAAVKMYPYELRDLRWVGIAVALFSVFLWRVARAFSILRRAMDEVAATAGLIPIAARAGYSALPARVVTVVRAAADAARRIVTTKQKPERSRRPPVDFEPAWTAHHLRVAKAASPNERAAAPPIESRDRVDLASSTDRALS